MCTIEGNTGTIAETGSAPHNPTTGCSRLCQGVLQAPYVAGNGHYSTGTIQGPLLWPYHRHRGWRRRVNRRSCLYAVGNPYPPPQRRACYDTWCALCPSLLVLVLILKLLFSQVVSASNHPRYGTKYLELKYVIMLFF